MPKLTRPISRPVRMTAAEYEELKRLAAESGRSVNQYLIDASLGKLPAREEILETLKRIEAKLDV